MEIKFLLALAFIVSAVIIFIVSFFVSINKHKNGKIIFFSKDYSMLYLDAVILSGFVLIKELSLYTLLLYFILESIAGMAVVFLTPRVLRNKLGTFFNKNKWTEFLLDPDFAIRMPLLLILLYSFKFNIMSEMHLPVIYLVISTVLSYRFTKNKAALIVKNMVGAAVNYVPIFVIFLILLALEGNVEYTVYIALFFIIMKTFVNIAAVQTLCKFYLDSLCKDENI